MDILSKNLNKSKKRAPLALQLTPLIDIVSMLVIFLIMGMFMNALEVPIPGQFTIPKSVTTVAAQNNPTITILKDNKLNINFINLLDVKEVEQEILTEDLQNQVTNFIETLQNEKKPTPTLNILADASEHYNRLYNVARVFQELGFQKIAFVTTPE